MVTDLLANIKSKKVKCDQCGKLVEFSSLKNIGSSKIDHFLVCKKCYYKA